MHLNDSLHRTDRSSNQRRDSGNPLVSIIIPVFDQVRYTSTCLESIFEKSPRGQFEVIVIDNHSTDGTPMLLASYGDDVRVLTNEENLGFATACNQGARAAVGRYLVFLNNDTEVRTGWLEPLIERIESGPNIAAVGSQLLYPDGTVQHAGVIIIAQEGQCALLPRHVFAGEDPGRVPIDQAICLQAVTAACMLVRKDAFEQAGAFDESFWNGSEDVDLCFKLRQAGGNIVYEPRSVVVHHESKSGKERQAAQPRNNARLRARWASIIQPDIIQEGPRTYRNPDSPVCSCAGIPMDSTAYLDQAAVWWAGRQAAAKTSANSPVREPQIADGLADHQTSSTHRFWKPVIEPALKAIAARRIVEIGSGRGLNTRKLLDYCQSVGGRLHVIDPSPKYAVKEWEERYPSYVQFHLDFSLNAIWRIEAADAVLISGDHNWYTVFNELKLIEKAAKKANREFPLVLLHHVGWPHGRRDQYHNPETIPTAFRKPYKKLGLKTDSNGLAAVAGLNPDRCHSIYENDLQNGVLTAAEDFVAETPQEMRLRILPGIHGLGVLYPASLESNEEFRQLMTELCLTPRQMQLMEIVERQRIEDLIRNAEQSQELKKLELLEQQKMVQAERLRQVEHALERERQISGQKQTLLAEKDRQLQQQERELSKLLRWLEQADRDVQATLASWRWKVGDKLIRLVEILLLRSRVPLAMDHLQGIFSQLRNWQQASNARLSTVYPAASRIADSSVGDQATTAPPMRRESMIADHLAYTLPADLPASELQAGLSVIILSRNGAALLEDLLASFQQYLVMETCEILVVDHNSTDNSLQVLEKFSQTLPLRIFALQENQSYAESNNFAAGQARYRYLLLINNDIVLTREDTIHHALRALQDPLVGVVGMTLLYPPDHPAHPGEIQHAGIRFYEDLGHGFFRPYNLQPRYRQNGNIEAYQMPAVTAAALFCRREEFIGIGGFFEQYDYGYEDVDLCLHYQTRLGLNCVLLNQVTAIHNESATQKKDRPQSVRTRRERNIQTLQQRYGYALKRRIRQDQLRSTPVWTEDLLIVGFAVTEAHPETSAGDYFTALELAGALEAEFGWETRFLARRGSQKDWYDLSGIDVLVVMIDAYDLRKLRHCKPGLIRVAWMRNWFERWAEHAWFGQYDIFLCSSQKSANYIRDEHGKAAQVLRIACNEKRFSPAEADGQKNIDYCFTGSHWEVRRDIENLDPRRLPWIFALYGKGWDKHEHLRDYWKGFLPYHDLPTVYRHTRVLIDDANHVTKPWASVNSRVFDALACGILVLSNGFAGAKEVFGDLLPTYENVAELEQKLRYYLENPQETAQRVQQLRDRVLAEHTYSHRAHELQSILNTYRSKLFRFAIKVPAPKWEVVHEWGDYHFAGALQRALVREGHSVRIDILPEWYTAKGFGDDIVLVLRGLSAYEPQPGHLNLMWNISHPDKVTDAEYARYDHVFVASRPYAEQLRQRLQTPVSALLQCTDPALFHPDDDDQIPQYEVLFVGNSRKQYRPIVKHAVEAGLPLNVFGTRWEGLIPPSCLRGQHIPNGELRKFYSRCKVLLNDHWPEMRQQGFVSNRLFDACACGAAVVSDAVEGLQDLFGGAVLTYDDSPAGLRAQVESLLQDESRRAELRERAKVAVLAGHTFDHRTKAILRVVREMDAERCLP